MLERVNMIKRELEEHKRTNSHATYPINFRGDKQYLPVVKIKPEWLVLNHKNNRISAQLVDHPKRAQVESNPTLAESQDIIVSLLAETDKFNELKDQLETLGQREPGLITREGLLVNGNTRVAAMKKLGTSYIEVAVLPENINESDVLDIEMVLQVTDLVHQDYTFTNELLLMRKFLDAGGDEKTLAKKMAWVRRGESKVKLHMRLLSYIEEIRSLAKNPMPYSTFDSKKQHLKDLDDDYNRLKNEGDIGAAENLKWTRMSMVFLGLNKDQVRAIDEDFVEDHLIPRLVDNAEGQASLDYLEKYRSEEAPDDFDDILGPSESSSINMKGFFKDLLDDATQRDDHGELALDTEGVSWNIAFNAKRASDGIIDSQKLKTAKAKPSEILKDMRAKLRDLRSELPELIFTSEFKQGQFEYDLKKVHDELNKIDELIKDRGKTA